MNKYNIVIIGLPNSGKSTLLNRLAKSRVSIVTHRKNTTRVSHKHLIKGKDYSLYFIDTPGFVRKVTNILDKNMNIEINKHLSTADIILYLQPYWKLINRDYIELISTYKNTLSYFIPTKIDIKINNFEDLYILTTEVEKLDMFEKIIPISSEKDKNINTLIEEINLSLKLKEKNINVEKIINNNEINQSKSDVSNLTTNKVNLEISEIIRETYFTLLRDEIPYTMSTRAMLVYETADVINIEAEILTNKEKLKKIIIGTSGEMVKKIGTISRGKLEKKFNKNVFLKIKISYDKEWKNRNL